MNRSNTHPRIVGGHFKMSLTKSKAASCPFSGAALACCMKGWCWLLGSHAAAEGGAACGRDHVVFMLLTDGMPAATTWPVAGVRGAPGGELPVAACS